MEKLCFAQVPAIRIWAANPLTGRAIAGHSLSGGPKSVGQIENVLMIPPNYHRSDGL